jgi:hypothetical protein
MKEITKIYVTSTSDLTERDVCYVVMSNKAYIHSIKKLARWNFLVEIEYLDEATLKEILSTSEVRGKKILVRRVFKSLKKSKFTEKTPSGNFILQTIMGISGLIKKPVKIKVTNNRANDWQKELLKRWQEELDHPNIFKKAGIKPVIDISPNGELEFCIVGGKGYIVTFFNKNIDEYC